MIRVFLLRRTAKKEARCRVRRLLRLGPPSPNTLARMSKCCRVTFMKRKNPNSWAMSEKKAIKNSQHKWLQEKMAVNNKATRSMQHFTSKSETEVSLRGVCSWANSGHLFYFCKLSFLENFPDCRNVNWQNRQDIPDSLTDLVAGYEIWQIRQALWAILAFFRQSRWQN